MFNDDDKCDICSSTIEDIIKIDSFNYILKCSNCVFKSCNNCIGKWYEKSFQCPYCKQDKTYDVNTDINTDNTDINTDDIYAYAFLNVQLGLQGLQGLQLDLHEQIQIPKNATNISDYIQNNLITFHPEKSTRILNVETQRYVYYNGPVGKRILRSCGILVINI